MEHGDIDNGDYNVQDNADSDDDLDGDFNDDYHNDDDDDYDDYQVTTEGRCGAAVSYALSSEFRPPCVQHLRNV